MQNKRTTAKKAESPAATTMPLAALKGNTLRDIMRAYHVRPMGLRQWLADSYGMVFSESHFSHFLNSGRWPAGDRHGLIAAIMEYLSTLVPTAHAELVRADLQARIDLDAKVVALRPVKSPSLIDPLEKAMLSTTARAHFALSRDPFTEEMRGHEDVFLSADQRYVREALYSTVKNGGFLAVIGESGSGKSTLRQDLAERMAREQMPCTMVMPRTVDKTKLTASLIVRAIVFDLDETSRPSNNHEQQARLAERLLLANSKAGNRCVLIIEEAQDLDKRTLKYLKRFYELQDGFKKLLSIVLIGQPELKRLLDERTNWDAREVIRRCEVAELHPFAGVALENYVEHKFKRIGADAKKLMSADAYDAIRARLTKQRPGTMGGKPIVESQLYPLTVNNLITRAMNACADLGAPKVTGDVIKGI